MAPTPQDFAGLEPDVIPEDRKRVVISGMSGVYPKSNNVMELSHILYNQVDPISTNVRWKYSHPEVSPYVGNAPGLHQFDAQFFKVHYRLGNSMDSMSRKILEHCYQAVFDAGLSPELLARKKVGVFIGTSFSESEKASFYLASTKTGFGILGCSRSMYANRVSYWLNLKGPSMNIDDCCCSSTAALEQAHGAISRGDCDAAIVGASSICIHPQSTVLSGRCIPVCPDGKTKSFDEKANGCVKSEAIVIFILQKAEDALRVYAELVHVKSRLAPDSILECVTGQEFGFNRNPLAYEKFLNSFYSEAKISPVSVEYVEACGSGVPEVDKTELDVISKVYCKGRKDPLLVGSVMSNVGYTEASSGAVALTKVLLGYHNGDLAANLHLTEPRKDVEALQDGRVKIVTKNEPFSRAYTAINNLSITGSSGHMLLHGHYKPKDPTRYQTSIPRLVVLSGRHESAAQKILDDLKSRPIDPEELALLHNVHSTSIAGHLGKAYTILDTNAEQKTVCLAEACEYFDDAPRPLWFVYSGMGSQWAGMAAQLMRIPIFAAAIDRCQKALDPKGINLTHIITSPDKTIFDNILHSFVGIAAVQIGLTDVLKEIGLVPDKIIGHSVGELGCAYADGCFSAEEMILAAYSRGLVSVETPFIRGSMAAVGLGYQQIIDMVPPEIEVACHNSATSSTISGPADAMREFVTSLAAKGVFAKEVPCSNIAYHSRYIAEAGPGLLKYLKEVIKDPKPRSERWVSTSVPMDKWDQPSAKYSSAEYHTNNLLNPVLFEETSKLIPRNAVLVEIAPHGLLQAILKRALPAGCRHVPLTRRGHTDNALFVLEAIGKLHMEGYNLDVAKLYPKVEFPVSTGTPMLSHLVEWAHNETWKLPLHLSASQEPTAIYEPIISVQDDESSFLRGNVIRGKTLYPFASALVAAWDTLAMTLGKPKKGISVIFKDVNLYVQPILYDQKELKLNVSLHRGQGWFEILNGAASKVATGFIESSKMDDKLESTEENQNFNDEDMPLKSEDVYQLLYDREYAYSGDFRSIQRANISMTKAYIEWSNNWVTLLDGILQLNILKQNHDSVSEPRRIRSIIVDVDKHSKEEKLHQDGKDVIKLYLDSLHSITRCGGVTMHNVSLTDLPALAPGKMTLNRLGFVPHFNSNLDVKTALQVFLQIVAQNVNKKIINVMEIKNYSEEETIYDEVRELVNSVPDLKVQFKQLKKDEILQDRDQFIQEVDLVLVQNLSMDDSIFEFLYNILPRDTFITISEESSVSNLRARPSALYRVVSTQNTGDLSLHLSRWRPNATSASITAFTVRSRDDFSLLSKTRDSIPANHKLLVLTSYPPVDGVKDLIANWRAQTDKSLVQLVMFNHNTATDQDLELAPELELAFNVLNDSVWGGEYYLPLEEKEVKTSNVTLRCDQIGDLDSMRWVESPRLDNTQGISVDVHYAALNTLDAKRAMGVYNFKEGDKSYSFGMDFSGITTRGTPVMGIVADGACSTRVKANPKLLWPVPSYWTLEEAATVPLPYALAFYCLTIKYNFMWPQNSILVHGGAGALGQAAISICLARGMRVFTTVSDLRKKHFLRKLFPELKDNHIGCSRDHTFGDMVRSLTNGRGVNCILNCVPGDLKNESLSCIGSSGVLFDTVQIPGNEEFAYGMYNMTMERNYVTVNFSSILAMDNQKEIHRIQLLISDGIARGFVRPLSRVTYAPHEAARALRLLGGSRHRGRVLLRLAAAQPPHQPSITSHDVEQKCQLVVSDDTSLGLQLTDHLVSQGAKKLHLQMPIVPAQTLCKQISWKNVGAEVSISTEDLRDHKNTVPLLNKVESNSLEGIYLVSTKASGSKLNPAVVETLDSFARKHSKTLKYFAVISDDHSLGNATCYSRANDKLPATKLIVLPSVELSGASELSHSGALSWRQALGGLSCALHSSQPVVTASSRQYSPQSILDKIASIAGIEINEKTNETATLEELGVTQDQALSLKVLMCEEHNLWFTEEQVLSMPVHELLNLAQFKDGRLEKVKGLEAFFSYIDKDELMATIDMVFLPTLASKNTEEFNVTQKYLCIVPGLEGNYERFRELSKRLKVPALVLQAGLDRPREPVASVAQRLAATLLKKARVQDHFYLLGYESGVMVALELAALLEEHGLTGTVYCIGCPPKELQVTLDQELKEYASEGELQNAVLRHLSSLMTGRPCHLEFRDDHTWQEKMEYCKRSLSVPFSGQYMRAHFEAAYGKIMQIRQYQHQPKKLRSNIVFLRTESKAPISEQEPLQQYSEQPIIVHDLGVPLAHALKDLRCANLINQNLHPDILQEFETKNLCELFTIKTAMFTTPEELGIEIE